jgi:multiple sugar transport system substrate-binding protein
MARPLTRALLLVLAAFVAGCGGAGDGAEGGTGTISFLVFGEPEELRAYRDVVARFREREPEITVKLIEASDRTDLLTRLSTSFAGGTPPDLFLVNYRFYGQFAARGVLEPIEERIEQSDAFALDDFYDVAIDAFRWDGQLTCLPQNVSSLVVYYNRDLLRRFSVPEPKDDWTWLDFVRTAAALTRDEHGLPIQGQDPDLPTTSGPVVRPAIYGVGVEPTIIRLAPFVWSMGGDIVDDQERPTRLTLATDAAQRAMAEFFALRTAYGVVPTDAEVEAEDDESRFANGRLAMLLSSRRAVPALRASARFDWDVAPLPRFQEKAGILHSDAFCMAGASTRKDAAWRFVEFALGFEGQRILARTGRTVPSLKDVAESGAFLDPAQKPARSQVFLEAIPTIRRVPTISTWPEIEDATAGILENGMYLGTPVPEVARQVDEATRPMFARARR